MLNTVSHVAAGAQQALGNQRGRAVGQCVHAGQGLSVFGKEGPDQGHVSRVVVSSNDTQMYSSRQFARWPAPICGEQLWFGSVAGLDAQGVKGAVLVAGVEAELGQALCGMAAKRATRWAMRFKPCGPWYTAYMLAITAGNTCAVQMCDVAFRGGCVVPASAAPGGRRGCRGYPRSRPPDAGHGALVLVAAGHEGSVRAHHCPWACQSAG